MAKLTQSDLSGGEVSPAIAARTDIDRYRSSLAKCENFFTRSQGGASNRAGFRHIAEVKDSTKKVRLRPFEFNTTQTYILEVGDLYMRFYRNGGLILDSAYARNITAATNTNPVVVTSATHGLTTGDEVFISNVAGMTELNGRQLKVTVLTADTFEIQDMAGVDVDGTSYGVYTSGGFLDIPYEIVTPYPEADLAELYFVQSADVMTITHPSYQPRELVRLDHDDWTLEVIVFQPEQDFPRNMSVSVGTTGTVTDRYVVTATSRETAEESLRGTRAGTAITAATNTDPVVITSAGHGLVSGDTIHIDSIVGMEELNGGRFVATVLSASTFEIADNAGQDIDGTGYGTYTSGGFAYRTFFKVTNSNTTRKNTVTWTAVSGAESYNVYREDNGIFGFIGRTEQATFLDDNIEPDLSDTPPKTRDPFVGTGNYPSVAGFFKQRRVFANTDNKTQTLFFTQTGNIYNFSISSPTRDDDAITATLAGLKANEIRALVPLQDLVVMTSGAEWAVTGVDGKITPSEIQTSPQSYYGSSSISVPPIVAGNTVLFLQNGQIVRDLGYSFQQDAYAGNDISILARHLFDYNTIDDWSFAIAPYGILWCVRDDGVMLGLTYLREQEKFAWHRHTTKGDFLSVATIREGTDDILYALIQRDIGGRDVKFVERMDERKFSDIQDAYFLDCGETWDNPVDISGYTNADPIVVTASSHGFSDGDTVDISGVYVHDTSDVRGYVLDTALNGNGYVVANSTANTFELLNNGVAVDSTAFATYSHGGEVRKAITNVTGLWHLEGETVTAVGNGYVSRNHVVTNGAITLPDAASRIHVGFEYRAEIETLRLDIKQGQIQGMAKKVSRLSVLVEDTLGMFTGVSRDRMREKKFRLPLLYGQPPEMVTGVLDLTLPPDWNKDGTYVVQQRDPLPMTLLALVPDGTVGGN